MSVPESLIAFFQDQALVRDLVATAILFATAFGLRHIALRFIRRRLPKSDQLQLRWAAQIRAFFYAVLAFGIFVIWAQQLQALAVSFVVLAMAIVWATKETLTCVQGAVYRVSSNAFAIGDRIKIEGIRGDVIDQGVLSTLVLEVGEGHQRTGRTISIPNSIFLTSPVLNESLAGQYMLHVMRIPVDRNGDLAGLEHKALSAAREACADFLDDVRRSIALRYRRHGLNPPLVEPRITYQVIDKHTVHLLLRIPTPIRLEREVEQKVLRAVLGVPEGRDTLAPQPPG
ncbi:MAG: mechanosensitive ion channel family protein [Polyangiales bacterium]